MATEVRRADTEDAAQIAEIIAEVRGDSNPTGFEDAQTPEQVESWITRQGGGGAMLVVDDGRHTLAFAALDFDSSKPDECSFGDWVRVQNRRQGHGTALAEDSLAFAHDRGYKRIRARLPQDNVPALSYLSSIGALVPMTNPGTSFELPIYQENE
jgi:RimJ/RimL family protein N-acetyltransferase